MKTSFEIRAADGCVVVLHDDGTIVIHISGEIGGSKYSHTRVVERRESDKILLVLGAFAYKRTIAAIPDVPSQIVDEMGLS